MESKSLCLRDDFRFFTPLCYVQNDRMSTLHSHLHQMKLVDVAELPTPPVPPRIGPRVCDLWNSGGIAVTGFCLRRGATAIMWARDNGGAAQSRVDERASNPDRPEAQWGLSGVGTESLDKDLPAKSSQFSLTRPT